VKKKPKPKPKPRQCIAYWQVPNGIQCRRRAVDWSKQLVLCVDHATYFGIYPPVYVNDNPPFKRDFQNMKQLKTFIKPY
jgi:hypothetical protein